MSNNIDDLKQVLENAGLDSDNIKIDEPMALHTSFKVGGPADIFIELNNVYELIIAIKKIKEAGMTIFVLGKGTNLLVSDQGIRGAVIKIGEKISNIEVEGECVVAEAGCLLSVLGKTAARNALTGIEFASGIPGTLGGGLAMNAGAYDGELKNFVEWVEVLNQNLEIQRLTTDEMDFGYRHSCLGEKGYIAIRSKLKLHYGNQEEINFKMNDFAEKRRTKQPLDWPSAGSTFRRPPGNYAGKLVQDAGLRGFNIGGASVSELHTGFVVTNGEATATEIFDLIKYIQKKVLDNSGVLLKPEVKMVGEFEKG